MNEEECNHEKISNDSYISHFYLQTFVTMVTQCDECGKILHEEQSEVIE